MRRLSTLVFALHCAAIPLAAQARLTNTTAYTTAAVTVRARPDARAKSVARLAAESPVQVATCANGWCQIAVNGLAGYLPRLFLSQQPQRLVQRGIRLYQLERQSRAFADAHAGQSAAGGRERAVQGRDVQLQPVTQRDLLASWRCGEVAELRDEGRWSC